MADFSLFDPPAQRSGDASADEKATDHLANERTFLAWVRACVTLMSLGFVVARFGLWLERLSRLAPGFDADRQTRSSGWSLPIGVGLMGCGALLTVVAAWHHRPVSREIEAGKVEPATRLVICVGVLIAALVAHLLVSAR